jgi:hypothetical protein
VQAWRQQVRAAWETVAEAVMVVVPEEGVSQLVMAEDVQVVVVVLAVADKARRRVRLQLLQ